MKPIQIHGRADVQTESIGQGTRIWQYCVILQGAVVGANCNICAHVLIENDVVIGDDVTVKSGVQLWDGLRIGDGVFIGPNATFANDRFPRSKQYPEQFSRTEVGAGASIGANATILPGISIGAGAMVGAGAVVTKNVPPNAIVVGNPGVITGYVGTGAQAGASPVVQSVVSDDGKRVLGVGDCALHSLPQVSDMRGNLAVAEYDKHLPFVPQRCFWVFDVPSREVRGEHAHKSLHEFVVCLRGSVHFVLDDSKSRSEVILDKPNVGLYIPPCVWRVHYKYSPDAILLAFASDVYQPDDYIRNYEEFVEYVQFNRGGA